MSIDTTFKTTNNSISVTEPSKPEKTCYSLYKIAKWVLTAAFWILPQQVATRPLERPSVLEVPSVSISTPKNTSTEGSLEPPLSPEANKVLREKRLIARALKSKIIVALCKEAAAVPTAYHKSGPWKILFTEGLMFGAVCCHMERAIRLNLRLSDDEALSALIFELMNAIQSPEYEKLKHMAIKNEINREEYALSYERIEYDIECWHRKIFTAVIKEMGWGMHLLSIQHKHPDKYPSFKDYVKTQDKGNHTELYRQQWDRLRASTS